MKNYTEIEKIHNKRQEVIFRCAIDFLIQNGASSVAEYDLEEVRKQAEAEVIERGGKGTNIISTDFQVEIVACAKELALIPVWDLLAYIKDNVFIDGCIDTYKITQAVKDLQGEYCEYDAGGQDIIDQLVDFCCLSREDNYRG